MLTFPSPRAHCSHLGLFLSNSSPCRKHSLSSLSQSTLQSKIAQQHFTKIVYGWWETWHTGFLSRAWQLPGSLVLSKVGLFVLFLLGTVLAAGTRGRRSGAHALRQGERGGEKRGEEAAPSRNDLQEETIMSCPSCCPRCPSGTPRPCDHGEVA